MTLCDATELCSTALPCCNHTLNKKYLYPETYITMTSSYHMSLNESILIQVLTHTIPDD